MVKREKGTVGLMCAECLRVVGVINADALQRMYAEGKMYVCSACLDGRGAAIDVASDDTTSEHWYRASQALVNPVEVAPCA